MLFSPQELLFFALAALVLVLTPGPNMVYCVSRSLTQGPRAGLISLAGVVLGFVVHLLAAALGLTALLAAVRSGQVGSAGLDSFAVEPMTAPHPFQDEPHITLSPHIGGVTTDAYVRMGVEAARNALAVLHP